MSKPKWACFGLYFDISPDCSCYGGGFYDTTRAARWMRGRCCAARESLYRF